MNLIEHQRQDVCKIYLYVPDPFDSSTYQLFINKRKKIMVTRLKKSKTFIDYPQTIEDVYANLEDCNHTKKENF